MVVRDTTDKRDYETMKTLTLEQERDLELESRQVLQLVFGNGRTQSGSTVKCAVEENSS